MFGPRPIDAWDTCRTATDPTASASPGPRLWRSPAPCSPSPPTTCHAHGCASPKVGTSPAPCSGALPCCPHSQPRATRHTPDHVWYVSVGRSASHTPHPRPHSRLPLSTSMEYRLGPGRSDAKAAVRPMPLCAVITWWWQREEYQCSRAVRRRPSAVTFW